MIGGPVPMTRRLLAATAALALLSACEINVNGNEQAQANAAAVEQNAQSAPQANEPQTVAIDRDTAVKLMRERHENYEKIGDAMKVVTRELKRDEPNLAAVRTGAQAIAVLAPQVPSWFPAGSGPDVGKTEARAQIWQRPEDFSAKAQAFDQAAKRFEVAVQGSDVEAMRAAHGDLGKTCKACHDLYREEH